MSHVETLLGCCVEDRYLTQGEKNAHLGKSPSRVACQYSDPRARPDGEGDAAVRTLHVSTKDIQHDILVIRQCQDAMCRVTRAAPQQPQQEATPAQAGLTYLRGRLTGLWVPHGAEET